MRSDFMSTRECKDLAMNWFAGEFRLAIEVSEVTSYCMANVLSSFAGEASSSSRKGGYDVPETCFKDTGMRNMGRQCGLVGDSEVVWGRRT